jgi:hypothetical protein
MDKVLRRNAMFALAFLFLFAFWGFWPKYFSIFLDQANWRFHFHGLTLISWCVLMVLQAYLIRTNKRAIHRATGKLSYLLVPLIIVSTILLSHYQEKPRELVLGLFGLAIVTTLLLQFIFAYGLAIYHRHNPMIHARFMICTALPMIPPIFDRIMIFYLLPPDQFKFLPQIDGNPFPVISYLFVDLTLIALSVWDWKSRRKLSVFPVVLAAFVLFQVPTYVAHRTEIWRVFGEWFLNLPLS